MNDIFGEPIYKYTAKQAIDDGILMRNPSKEFSQCTLITTNLWESLKEGCKDKHMDKLDEIMRSANKLWQEKNYKGDEDENFFTVKSFSKPVWFCRNEYGTLTAMLPDDY